MSLAPRLRLSCIWVYLFSTGEVQRVNVGHVPNTSDFRKGASGRPFEPAVWHITCSRPTAICELNKHWQHRGVQNPKIFLKHIVIRSFSHYFILVWYKNERKKIGWGPEVPQSPRRCYPLSPKIRRCYYGFIQRNFAKY